MSGVAGKRVLLVISGGIAAYKVYELIRMLRRADCGVTCVTSRSATQFVTPLTLQALSESPVYHDMFSLIDEKQMGHIQLSRVADLVVVAPATADILARMTAGLADDLATTVLLATDKPILVAPAMNVRMWHHPATQANLAILRARGVRFVGPREGAMACHEFGLGRLSEPPDIFAAISDFFAAATTGGPLAGKRAIVTSGPTQEPIDPVRYIANRSSGQQGHAIAAALAKLGAHVTLISGPVALPDPPVAEIVKVTTAVEMRDAAQAALPADIVVCAAAVADWRMAEPARSKMKKTDDGAPPRLVFVANPDILATLSSPGPDRPSLVIGFAAETDDVVPNAIAKRARKGCDWLLANDVRPDTGIMGGAHNQVHLVTKDGVEAWPMLDKIDVAQRLAARITEWFS
jgi:phosphopantothenoylcysteine decarboxylase/phosphopantothenate--cysteine ligase